MRYSYGIDAGGSTTVCAIADPKGNLVAIGHSGAGNYKLVGVEVSQKSIREAIWRALLQASLNPDDLGKGFYAISGLDTEEDRNVIRRFVSEISPTETFELDNDAIASLLLGTARGHGVVIICGTGSNVVAINPALERLQVGGLGREFGDFAGGREIAFQAMAAAQRGHDGRGPKTGLYDIITRYLGVETLADFTPILHYSARAYPIANLVPLVFAAARQGDEVALNILRRNGEELALSAGVAIEQLFGDNEKVEVVLTGGVFRLDTQGVVVQTVQKELLERFPNLQFRLPKGEPVLGSLIHALRQSGLCVTEEHKRRLVEQLAAFTNIVDEFQA